VGFFKNSRRNFSSADMIYNPSMKVLTLSDSRQAGGVSAPLSAHLFHLSQDQSRMTRQRIAGCRRPSAATIPFQKRSPEHRLHAQYTLAH
jgi:hypothetical protein